VTTFEKLVEIETRGGPNKRMGWRKRADLASTERGLTKMLLGWNFKPLLPCVITLRRRTPTRFLDDDNLRGVLKSVRDGVADRIGLDDGDARIEWRYEQVRCKRGEFGVFVRFESK
jgi:hypothetical protein